MKAENIRKACEISSEIVGSIPRNIRNFRTEKDIGNFLRKEAKKRKLKLAFQPIVASGKNSAEIHHKPKNTRLKKGFLVVDFGVKYKGYCSDMTRTFYIGKASKKEKMIYGKLLAVQNDVIKLAKAGADCFEIDYSARKKLLDFRQYFSHSLGHGVGKNVHEKPNLSVKSIEKLKKGDAITIEPGIYVPKKFGIRIEDTVLIGKKPVVLTKLAKSLVEIRL